MLDTIESFEFLRKFPLAKYKIVEKLEDLSGVDFPCFLKLSTSQHKTRLNSVFECHDYDELGQAFKKLKKRFKKERFVVQEKVKGREVIVGLKRDNVFGKVLLVGEGGIYTEEIDDVSFRVLPIEKREIKKMLDELKIYSKIREKMNEKKLVKLILKLSRLDVKELDVNPVIVNEKEALIVDARVKV